MRMVRNVAMALAMFATATAANAASSVWYQATNINGDGTGAAGGAIGTPLVLTCNAAAAGNCTWAITMMVNSGTGGLVQQATDLHTAAGNGLAASAATYVAAGNPLNADTAAGTGGQGANLLIGTHSDTFTPGGVPAASQFALITFTLTETHGAGDTGARDVLVSTSPDSTFVWANTNGDYELVGFGANPPYSAVEGTSPPTGLPVIHINNVVPEPTTLGLLVLGGLAALRRRVAR
jgi:hypothetical protein